MTPEEAKRITLATDPRTATTATLVIAVASWGQATAMRQQMGALCAVMLPPPDPELEAHWEAMAVELNRRVPA